MFEPVREQLTRDAGRLSSSVRPPTLCQVLGLAQRYGMVHLAGTFPAQSVHGGDIVANPREQQYTKTIKQVQDAMLAGLETWTRTFQQALDELSAAAPAREQLIDQGFDFIGKLVNAQLNAQRHFAKQLAASGTAVTETVRAGAAEITEALREGSVL
jgi:hypothetical protein